MIKRTIIDKIEILQDGIVQLRISKQIVDGESVLMSEPHRTVIEPFVNTDEQMKAVNDHLTQMGWPAVSEYGELKSYCSIAQTPERASKRIAYYKNAEKLRK